MVLVEDLKLFLLGVTPGGLPPLTLCERFLPGVGARFGAGFLNGDSGRGKEGLLGLNCGLGGLAPGPTVCAKR